MLLMRRAAVVVLDVLAVALTVLAAVIIKGGGFILLVADVRIRLRTPARTLLWLAAVVLLRLAVDRRSPLFAITVRRWRRLLAAPRGIDWFTSRARPGLWRRTAWASIGIAAALAIILRDQMNDLYSVADRGDPLFSIWRIAWVLHQLVTDPMHLFDTNIFYPTALTLTFSDPVILPALMSAPLFAAGLHPVVVYNLLFLSGFWLSGIATYVLAERLTGSARAAFVAGLIYACYSYRFDHYSHLELQMTQWMPLGLLALHLFIATGRWPYAIALAMAGVAQLYSSMYYAVFFLVYATAIGIGLVFVYRPSAGRVITGGLAAAALAGVLAIPLARAFMAAQPIKGDRPVDEIRFYSALPVDYLRTHKYSVIWKERALPPLPERSLFPGAAPVLLAAIGLVPPLTAIQAVYAVGLLVAFDGSLGFNGVTYPYLHEWLPPVRGLRAPARFAALVGLSLAAFAAFGAARLMRWCPRSWIADVALTAIVVFVIVDARARLDLFPVWRDPPVIYESLRDKPGVVLAEFPVVLPESNSIPFMYFSIWHWKPMVNGYSGFVPVSYYKVLEPQLVDFKDVDVLRARGVTHVTVNCGLDLEDCNSSLSELEKVDGLRLVEESRWADEAVRLYEVLRR